ncbi:MAG: Type cbb3 cytochrome oxidase biogenesis protein CcoS, involved in heme b insertion [uncultured Thiotrichaceae bacterium]|uniref:Type cbb3 cytochrome oxidase biogenesis protein CcoS, involved in heme b insertion n=1 Tax=uncultured Thiotrichaceae bacterium TaxID=298394 RepID=A0A6S6T3H5_9GAMM|nr:MAG: Type cbb3 cytochrome oxidase biogenesis protein CcoS, involved in heme b insertion [uncultured Thiotrichaceae bacterium]
MQIIVGGFVMLGVVIAFIITVKTGQYDDLDSPAHRILMDDDDPRIPANAEKLERQAAKEKQDSAS